MTIQVCDIVEYQGKLWRVTYHKKRVEDSLQFKIPSDDIEKIVYDILCSEWMNEKYSREERGLPANRRYFYKICLPHEATHLQLYGLTYPIAPIEKCKFIEVVNWSQELINQTKSEAISDFRLNNHIITWHWE